MANAYQAAVSEPDQEGSLSISAVLTPYLQRAEYVALLCAIAAGAMCRSVRPVRWWRVAANGLVVSLAGLVSGWTIDPGTGVLAWAAPVAVCGLPGALIALWRTRSFASARVVLTAWTLAAIVPAVAVRPFP